MKGNCAWVGVDEFLAAIQWNRERILEYEWGADGAGGKCDCIGLIIGALRHLGISWPGTHGTNYTARNRIRNLRKVVNAKDLALGELVFKAHEPEADDWALPLTYKSHPDQRDYFHVGVVTGIFPLQITHCTSVNGGIKVDTALGRWAYAGEMDLVDYGEGGETMPNNGIALYEVVNGRLALRSTPRKADNNFLKWLPDGAQVEGLSEPENGWVQVIYEGVKGYCLSEFLQLISPGHEGGASTSSPASGPPSPQGEGITIPREAAEMIYAALGEALG